MNMYTLLFLLPQNSLFVSNRTLQNLFLGRLTAGVKKQLLKLMFLPPTSSDGCALPRQSAVGAAWWRFKGVPASSATASASQTPPESPTPLLAESLRVCFLGKWTGRDSRLGDRRLGEGSR